MRNECRSNLCCYLLMNPAILIMPLWNSTSRNGNSKLYKNILNILAIIYKSGGGITPLNQKKWKEFYLSDIFTDIQRGKRLKTADHIQGNIPYVSSSAVNNGVDALIGNTAKIRKFADFPCNPGRYLLKYFTVYCKKGGPLGRRAKELWHNGLTNTCITGGETDYGSYEELY